MMESKEKAIELYNNFYNTSSHSHHVESRQYFAKQCSLIAVNEIIIELKNLGLKYLVEWWEEVKQEINKL